ncbi:MAG: sugar ABC transporter substrate-binding protein [Bacillota bacterium]
MNPGMKHFVVIGLVAALVVLPGCSKKKPAKKPSPPPLPIGVSISSDPGDSGNTIKKVLSKSAKQEKVRLTFKDARQDPARQIQDVESMIKQKVKAIILQPTDPVTGAEIAQRVAREGIKLIGINVMPPDTPMDGFITPDYLRIGELQAQFILDAKHQGAGAEPAAGTSTGITSGGIFPKALKGNKVLIFKVDGDTASDQITAGALGKLADDPQLQVVTRTIPRAPDVAQAVARILAEEKPAAVLAPNDPLILAIIAALRDQNRSLEVIAVGAGAGKEAVQAMVTKELDAEGDTMPDLVSQNAFQAALDLVQEGRWDFQHQINNGIYDIPAKVIPVRLIRQDNMFLLQERIGKMPSPSQNGQQSETGKSQEGESGSKSNSGGGEQNTASGTQEGNKGPKMKVLVRTKEGKTIEMDIEGEVERIEVKRADQEGAESKQGEP